MTPSEFLQDLETKEEFGGRRIFPTGCKIIQDSNAHYERRYMDADPKVILGQDDVAVKVEFLLVPMDCVTYGWEGGLVHLPCLVAVWDLYTWVYIFSKPEECRLAGDRNPIKRGPVSIELDVTYTMTLAGVWKDQS